MQQQSQQQSSNTATAIGVALHVPARPVFTVKQFAERNPAFTEAALRNLIFKAEPRLSVKGEFPGNGLIEAGAIVRLGRKVLIDESRFYDWLEAQQEAR